MPHFILDCSAELLDAHSELYIAEQIHVVAAGSGLFDIQDIKVRFNPYVRYLVGGKHELFMHVFSRIMQGRSTEQKTALSRSVVQMLSGMFPDVTYIAMSISEFEEAVYCNRSML
jgi:5-carboxymethyl-2-hydroxymuconate isomerase